MHEQIREHMDVIGADGVHVGTVDRLDGDRIKLTKADAGSGGHQGHHHFIPVGLVASVDDDTVRLSANADVAVTFEEEASGSALSASRREDDDEDDIASGFGESGLDEASDTALYAEDDDEAELDERRP